MSFSGYGRFRARQGCDNRKRCAVAIWNISSVRYWSPLERCWHLSPRRTATSARAKWMSRAVASVRWDFRKANISNVLPRSIAYTMRLSRRLWHVPKDSRMSPHPKPVPCCKKCSGASQRQMASWSRERTTCCAASHRHSESTHCYTTISSDGILATARRMRTAEASRNRNWKKPMPNWAVHRLTRMKRSKPHTGSLPCDTTLIAFARKVFLKA